MKVDPERLRRFGLARLVDDYPRAVVTDLYARGDFATDFKLHSSDFQITGIDIPISGKTLLDNVRKVLAPGLGKAEFTDDDGTSWTLIVKDPALALISAQSVDHYPDFGYCRQSCRYDLRALLVFTVKCVFQR